jgi:hypothetical protein
VKRPQIHRINKCLALVLFLLIGMSLQGQAWRLQRISFDTSPNSTGSYTILYYYYNTDSSTLPDSMYIEQYNSGLPSGSFRMLSKDESGQYITEIASGVVDTTIVHKQRGFYDSQERLICCRGYTVYDNELNPDGYRAYYGYDNEGNPSYLYSHDSYVWSGSKFHNNDIICDTQGRVAIENTKSSWDSLNWSDFNRNIYTYHDSDTMTDEQYIDNMRAHLGFSTYLYINVYIDHFCKGKTDNILRQHLHENIWYDLQRELHTYDEADNLVTCLIQNYSTDWVNSSKCDFAYDELGNVQVMTLKDWNPDINQWGDPEEIYQFFGETYTAAQDDVIPAARLSLSTWPNPFTTSISVSLRSKSSTPVEFSVYNIKGQLVKELGKIKDSSFIWDGNDDNGQPVSNGIYFLKARQGSDFTCRKIIRLKSKRN